MDFNEDNVFRELVTEYLIHNCYKNTAKAFLGEIKKLNACNNIPAGAGAGAGAAVVTTTTTKSVNGNDSNNRRRSNTTTDAMDIDDNEIVANGNDTYSWTLLDARKELYDAILGGDIPRAFDVINQHFPTLAMHDPQQSRPESMTVGNDNQNVSQLQRILFKLRCQQFIEIIRSSTEVEAIRFAQTHLRPQHKEFQELTNEVASLIAYPDPHNSNSSHLLSQERRLQLADELNTIVLSLSNLRNESSLERLYKQNNVVETELAKYTNGTTSATTTEKPDRERMTM
ncbi:CTLH/CRA C-terminal to lish motif domain-containing protein [Circinella umbellata]|nr:CTLH/CRA C-terminal to lish motif domain-containing protein [Circinella umbellata]